MPLVDGGVGGEKVEVFAIFYVPDAGSVSAGEDYGEGVVVVRVVFGFEGEYV